MNDTLRETYNRIAEQWDRDHEQDDWWLVGMERFVALLPQGADVLDVGCGSGHKARRLADRGFHVYGIDISDGMVALATARVPEGEFQVMDMRDMARLGRTYDAVVSQASLLHIPRREAPGVVRTLASAVVPGGYLYIAVKAAKEGLPLEEHRTEEDYGLPYTRFFSYYRQGEIEGMMTDAGLQVVESRDTPSGKTNWLQVTARKRA